MEKLLMCRICLMENVRMYAVVSKNMQDLYELLTDIPNVDRADFSNNIVLGRYSVQRREFAWISFTLSRGKQFVTEDTRPALACFFCYAKLKQCCQLQRQCREAEKLFAQMMNESNPSIHCGQTELFNAFVKTPVMNISINGVGQMEYVTIKEELPVYYEGLEDVIEPKEEPHGNDGNEYSDVEDTRLHHSESDLDITEFKSEVEEEQEVLGKKRGATDTGRSSAAEKPKEDTRTKPKDVIPEEQMKNKISETKIIQTTQSSARKGTFREPHKCDVCQSSFMRKRSLFKHIRTHTGETPYKCDICQRSFNKKTHLTNHIRTHTGEKPYKCDICQHSFSVQNALTLHIRTHTGEKPYKCDVCQRGFGRKGDLDRHSLTHTGEKPYKCDICQRSFNQKSNLLKHVRTHTGEERYKCDICQSRFNTRNNFKYHIRTHIVKKPFNCDICHRGCSTKNSLTLHIRTHTGEKPYKCDVCQRSFNRKDTLDRHFRTHNGEKPYKCNICERCFSIREHLVLHIRTHTGEKPYKCDICQRSFSSNHRLKLHTRTHTGEKPYKCDICQRSFRENGNLLKHIRTHTGVKPFVET